MRLHSGKATFIGIVVSAIPTLASAATWENRPTRSVSYDDLKAVHSDELQICDGKKPKQQFVLTFSSYNRPPSGVPTEKIATLAETQKALVEYLSRSLIQNMAAIAVDMKKGTESAQRLFMPGGNSEIGFFPNSDFFNLNSTLNSRLNPTDSHDLGERRRKASNEAFHFVRTGPMTFVLCRESQCAELEDPITKEKLEPVEFDKAKSTTQNAFVVDGKPELSRLGLNWTDYARLIYRTGFNLGGFIRDHYWNFPQQKKESLCRSSDRPVDCLSLPKTNPFKDGDAFSLVLHRAALAAGAGFADQSLELFDKGRRPNVSQAGPLAAEYESYLSLFFILWNGAVEESTKTEGPWSIHRLQFDPTQVCQYAKPRTDFTTH